MTKEEQDPQKVKKDAARMLMSFAMLIPFLLATSGAFYLLYAWHVLPLTGYALGFWQVFGLRLTLVVGLNIVRRPRPRTDGPFAILGEIIGAGLAVLLGWIAKLMI